MIFTMITVVLSSRTIFLFGRLDEVSGFWVLHSQPFLATIHGLFGRTTSWHSLPKSVVRMQPVKDGPCRCATSKLFPHRISKCKLNRVTNFSPANSLRNLVNQADLTGLTKTNSRSPQPDRRESNAPEYLDEQQMSLADETLQTSFHPTADSLLSETDQSWTPEHVRYPEASVATDLYLSEVDLSVSYEPQAPSTASSLPSVMDTPVATSPTRTEQQPDVMTGPTDHFGLADDNGYCAANAALPVAEEVSVLDRPPCVAQNMSLHRDEASPDTAVTRGPQSPQTITLSEPQQTLLTPSTEQLYVPAAAAVEVPTDTAALSLAQAYEPPLWAEPEHVAAVSAKVNDTNGMEDNGSGDNGGCSADSDGLGDSGDVTNSPSTTPRSDPQCRCAASLLQPHRASKCKLRLSAHKVKDAAQTATKKVSQGVTKGVTAIAQAPAPVVQVLRRRKGSAKNKNRTVQERSVLHVLWMVPRTQAVWTVLQLMRTTVLFHLVLLGVLLLGMGAVSSAMQLVVRLVVGVVLRR